MTFTSETLIHSLLFFLGAFYVFAGAIGIKVTLQARLYDVVIAAINAGKPSASETARGIWLLVAALLVFAGGLALVLRSEGAAWLFLASAAGQAIYLLWIAPVFLDPGDPPEARGRQQTTNAFILYAAVTAFVLWAYQSGRLIPVTEAPMPALAVAGLITLAATLYAGWKFWAPFAGDGATSPSDPSATPSDDAFTDPDDPDAAERPLHTSKGIVVMAEYHCDPLWAHDPDLYGTIAAAELGLTPGLSADLTAWSDAYTDALNIEDPLTPKWTPEQFRAHWQQGLALAKRLKRELPDREIFVFDSDSGHIEVHLDSDSA